MRALSKLALACTALAPLTGVASATTLFSDASTTLYTGYSASQSTPVASTSAATFNIGTGGTWAAPSVGSSWISFNPNTSPNGSDAQFAQSAANGFYTYSSSFNTGAGSFGSLTVMADDTVSVYLNGILQVAGSAGPYPMCAVVQPNCSTPYTFSLTGLVDGTNQLQFVVEQAGSYATGLDYAGSVTATPEPGSLMLLGSGLLTGAGTIARRLRRS